MRRLPKALRDNAFAVRVLGELQNGIFTVFDVTGQNDTLPMCGVGIDIGTTTVSAVLFDMKDGRLLSKASGGNGQIRYGADVINHIIEQGKPGGRKKLQDAILKETLVPLLQTLCKDAKLPPARIVRLCVASNTTMNHLFVGVDADPVRMEPYIPSSTGTACACTTSACPPIGRRHSPCAEHRLLCRRRYHPPVRSPACSGTATSCPCSSTSARTARSFSATATSWSRAPVRQARPSRRRHLLRHARNGRRDRVLRHRPRDDGADVRHHRRAGPEARRPVRQRHHRYDRRAVPRRDPEFQGHLRPARARRPRPRVAHEESATAARSPPSIAIAGGIRHRPRGRSSERGRHQQPFIRAKGVPLHRHLPRTPPSTRCLLAMDMD